MDGRWVCVWVFVACLGGGCDGGGSNDDGGAPDGGDADTPTTCEADTDCGGTFCEPSVCRPSASEADGEGCVAGDPPCAADETCDETSRACVGTCGEDPDADGDGHESIACGGDDCDDGDASRFPGNAEVCDDGAHDEDCNAETVGDRDTDSDGFVDAACCNDDVCGQDCDDTLADVRPDVAETCNGRDDDCDTEVDETGAEPLCPGGVCTAGSCRLDPWTHSFGGPGHDLATSVVIDDAGTVYVSGEFEDTAGFDGGELTATGGDADHVVVSYEADGTHRWDHQISGSLSNSSLIAAEAGRDSLFVGGVFTDELDLGDGDPVSMAGNHIYLARLDGSDGSVVERSIIEDFSGRLVGVATAGADLLVAGTAWSPISLGGTTVEDGFVVTLDESLTVTNARQLTGAADVRELATRPGGGYVVAAEAFGTIDLGCSSTYGGDGVTSNFVAAFGSAGDCDWIYHLDTSAMDFWDVAVDETGHVYLASEFGDALDFGGGERSSSASSNGVIVALDETGAYEWDRVFRSPERAELLGIAVVSDGVVAVGHYQGSLVIGGTTLGGTSGVNESVVVELSRSGSLRTPRTFESTGGHSALSASTGPGDSTVVVGRWEGSLTLGGTEYVSRTTSGGASSVDAYILRLSTS